MNKNKGFTLLEVIIALSLVSVFIFTALYIPVDLIGSNKNFESKQEEIQDFLVLRKSVILDLKNGEVEAKDNSVKIGKSTYSFSGERVARNGIVITRGKYNYKLNHNNSTIEIYNDDFKYEYLITTSLDKEGNAHEQ